MKKIKCQRCKSEVDVREFVVGDKKYSICAFCKKDAKVKLKLFMSNWQGSSW